MNQTISGGFGHPPCSMAKAKKSIPWTDSSERMDTKYSFTRQQNQGWYIWKTKVRIPYTFYPIFDNGKSQGGLVCKCFADFKNIVKHLVLITTATIFSLLQVLLQWCLASGLFRSIDGWISQQFVETARIYLNMAGFTENLTREENLSRERNGKISIDLSRLSFTHAWMKRVWIFLNFVVLNNCLHCRWHYLSTHFPKSKTQHLVDIHSRKSNRSKLRSRIQNGYSHTCRWK